MGSLILRGAVITENRKAPGDSRHTPLSGFKGPHTPLRDFHFVEIINALYGLPSRDVHVQS